MTTIPQNGTGSANCHNSGHIAKKIAWLLNLESTNQLSKFQQYIYKKELFSII